MGFWHTGYMEFHEPVGLDFDFQRSPTTYKCQHCDEIFASPDALLKHRFERHPFLRPALFVRGEELGNSPLLVTRPLIENDVVVRHCDSVRINGDAVTQAQLKERLLVPTNDKVVVELTNKGVAVQFEIVFSVAKESDLRGVDNCFLKMASERHLDVRAIESFIAAAKDFSSASTYCDGICHYLYGVLAKERAKSSSLPYASYTEKFNQSADILMGFDRGLARVTCALIAFHYNHFADAARLHPKGRVGLAAMRFESWLVGRLDTAATVLNQEVSPSAENLLTDFETLRILRWSLASASELKQTIMEVQDHARHEMPEYDRAKLLIVWAEGLAQLGELSRARRLAQELINNPSLGRWAERINERAADATQSDG